METLTLTPPAKIEQTFKNHEQILVHYICKLDIDVIDLFLDSKRTYQNMKKERFISLLGIAFEAFKKAGDTELVTTSGACDSSTCNFQKKGYLFKGNHSNSYFNLIIETENELVSDIYQCHNFKCVGKEPVLGRQITITYWNGDDE